MVIAALSLLAFQAQAPIAEMDFELVNGHIYVPATVNGNATTAILDSGAGMSVMDSALAEKWNLPSAGELQASGIGKDAVKGRYLKETKVSFGGITQPMQIAIPLGSLTEAEGRPLETIVGFELFSKNIVQIDYPAHKVRVYAKDGGFQPQGSSVPMRLISNHPHIKSSMNVDGKTYELETMIDTGASGGGLTAKFLAANPLSSRTTPKSVIGGGVGGFIEGRYFRPGSLTVAGSTVNRPIMTMTDAEGGASGKNSTYDLLLGADVLKRFTLTFDYSRSKVYFQASPELAKPFEADKTGLRLYATPDMKAFTVKGVMTGSTAEAAGIKPDDVIETIDGKPAGTFKLHQLREQFRSPEAKGWEFGVRRGGQVLKVKVEAKSVI